LDVGNAYIGDDRDHYSQDPLVLGAAVLVVPGIGADAEDSWIARLTARGKGGGVEPVRLHARLRSRWQTAKMDDSTAIEPQPEETVFLVWSASRRIGFAHTTEGGGIVVKLDPGEIVKSGNVFVLHPVR
jgi:hypothetical protein